jgi:hypothetical protein
MTNDTLSEDELIERIRACWPRCDDILRTAMDRMHDEFVKDGIDTNAAFNLVLVLVQREIFLRKTITIQCGRDNDSVIDWIKTEYDDWDT